MDLYKKIDDNLYVIYTGPEPCEDYINSYLLVSSLKKAVIIDPGPHNSTDKIYRVLKELGLEKSLELIIPTHVHLDHAGASARLAKLTGAAVIAHPRGIPHIKDPRNLWEASRKVQGDIIDTYGRPDDGENIELLEAKDMSILVLDDIELKILHSVGHASHHISILWISRSLLFTGDSAGIYLPEIDVVLPTTPPPFRYEAYMESLKKMIHEKPKTLAYTHKGVRIDGEFLTKHYEQMETWFNILISMDDNSLNNTKYIKMKIAEKDLFLRKYLEMSEEKDCVVNKANLEMTFKGFIEEIKRIKSL